MVRVDHRRARRRSRRAFGIGIAVVLVLRALPTAPPRARDAAMALLVVELAQGVIGFVQYFTDLPVALVAAHLVGAAVLVVIGTRLLLHVVSPAGQPSGASIQRSTSMP